MKRIFALLVVLCGIFLIFILIPQDRLISIDDENQEMIPVEPDNGIGNGAVALDELIESQVDEEIQGIRNPSRSICVGEYCDGSMSGEDDFTVVNIPLISGSGDVGCGSGLIFDPHVVKPKTVAVLDATYRTLFELKARSDIESDDIRNLVGQEDRLFYKGVSISDGVARLQLEGLTYKIAHCAIPEFRAQIEQSALQFDTVDSIEVYLNGDPWDWCEYSDADPSEDGCDQNPKLWITQK